MITGQMRPLAHHPHKVAHGLASLGRGNDSMLVHMSPNEVGALNKIAMATGGALTVNPHTGLPEAGWLSSLLPMLAGGIATVLTGGAAAPLWAALAGAGTGALTGDKKMSLFARMGLGALGGWGGGGLLSGLVGSAGSGLSSAAATQAANGAAGAVANGATTLGDVAAGAGIDAGTAASLSGGANLSGFAGDLIPTAIPQAATAAAGAAGTGAAALPAALPGAAEAAGAAAAVPASTTTAQQALANYNAFVPGSSAAQTARYAGQGLGNLSTSAGRGAFMSTLGDSAFGAPGVLAASLAPTLMQPQDVTGVEQQKPWYYTAAPGQKSLYNPGVINPNIAKLGYLPAGQAAFIGQQWNPGQYVQQYPGIPASQNPAGTIGAKAGGLMSLRHFDQGGSTSPAPSMSSALSGMNNYYKNMLNSSATQGPMTPTITTPSPDAMNAYLTRASQMVTPQSQSQPTVADVTPPSTTAPGGVPPGIDMSKIQQYLSGRGGMGGMGGTYPTYTYDPATGQYTQTGGGMGGRLGGFHMAQGGLTPNYAAGGKLLHGDGDGMSDSIPAVIGGQKPQRAALADGEFVVPADVVSHLGNGSTSAGAKRLYAMMNKVRQARTGNPKQGKQINPSKYLP